MSWQWVLRLLLLAALAALAYGFYSGAVVWPDRWNPRSPLIIAEQPNFLTRYKLWRLSGDDALCRQALADARMRFEGVPDRAGSRDCGLDNAVRIERTSARVSPPFVLSCRAAVSLALWEEHVLQPQALLAFGQEVETIEHFGSYSCRNVYGRERGRRSQHATADALDIAAFVLKDGRRISVGADWEEAGPSRAEEEMAPAPKARFLRSIHDGACRFFDGVLGPGYNRAHYNHFHFDRGAFRLCR